MFTEDLENMRKELRNVRKEVNLYEDIKYVSLIRLMIVIVISFSVIICSFIIGFFIWASAPIEETEETCIESIVEQDNEGAGNNNYINGGGEINNE